MDPLPLFKASSANIAQILKKCNDVSFVRVIQTCRGLYDIATQVEKKPRIYTTSFLVVFAYYDKRDKKVMFDVPYCEKEKKKQPPLEPGKHQISPELTEREEEDDLYWFELRSKEMEWEEEQEDRPRSELFFRRSDREAAFHKKMTAEKLGKLLQFFRFDTIDIDINSPSGCGSFEDPHPKRFLVAEEILKVFPYLQADALSLKEADSDELYDRTVLAAHEHWNLKRLLSLQLWEYSGHGRLDRLKIDWHTLEGLEGECVEEDIVSSYRDLITRWESGHTRIKYLKVAATRISRGFSGNFQDGPIFLKTEAHNDHDEFHYLHSAVTNRWAVTLWCNHANVFFFYDISDCDGCDCQTEFCFKKMMEVIGSRTDHKDAIDWGSVLDEWMEKKEGTMEELGEMIRELVDQFNPRARHCKHLELRSTVETTPCSC